MSCLAEQIRADGIDILIDLSLHSGSNRLRTFAIEPAPVQITYLGYCGTSGVERMHYRFSDPHLDPPDTDLGNYSEETIRLPETYWCYAPGRETPDPSPLPAKENGYVTFGSMNQFAKVSPAAIDLWCEILRRMPGSRLVFHAPFGNYLDPTRERFGRNGIAAERVEFVDRQTWEPYIRTYHRIDIGLDTFPYNGGITTCDTMWMGVPVVSLSGGTPVGRGGRSILCNLGLGDLVAYASEQYVDIAVALAGDLSRLEELRRTLRERMRRSPLMDAPRFARNMEAAYRQAWRRWCAGSDGLESRGSAPMTIAEQLESGASHHQAGRVVEAETLYKQVLARQPDCAKALHLLGVLAGQRGEASVAEDLIRRAVQIEPDLAEAYNNLGRLLAEKGETDEAIALYRRAIEIRPELADAHNNLGFALNVKEEWDAAIAAIREAIRINGQFAEAYINLGNALKGKRQLDDAIASFRRAINLRADLAEGHNNLGNALKLVGRVDEAIASIGEAIRLKPDLAEAHFNLGIALEEKGQLEAAMEANREAIRLRPAYSDAYIHLGNALCDMGRLDEANAAYREAVRLNPDSTKAGSNLVFVLNYDPSIDAAGDFARGKAMG